MSRIEGGRRYLEGDSGPTRGSAGMGGHSRCFRASRDPERGVYSALIRYGAAGTTVLVPRSAKSEARSTGLACDFPVSMAEARPC